MKIKKKPAEALTRALGDELDALSGVRSSRLLTKLSPEVVLFSGALDASKTGSTVTVAVSHALLLSIVGKTVAIFTGVTSDVQGTAVIASRPTADTFTVGAGLPSSFSNQSWKIVTPADTVAWIGNAINWPASGLIYLGGVRYTYATLEADTFENAPAWRLTGLEAWTGEAYVPGVAKIHPIGSEVVDYSRSYNSIDKTRRGMLVEYATGPDLSIVGRNEGVDRPHDLSDDSIFKKLIETTAYTYKGTIFAVERMLDAVLGAGTWEGFRDLTGKYVSTSLGPPSPRKHRVQGRSNHFATWFLRRRGLGTDPRGKAFLTERDVVPLVFDDPNYTVTLSRTPLAFEGIRYATEGGPRLIAESGPDASLYASYAATIATVTATTAGDFPAALIKKGDLYVVMSGPHAGAIGVVILVEEDHYITLAKDDALWPPGSPMLEIDIDVPKHAWKIVRPVSNFRWYDPTDEVFAERPGIPVWAFAGDTGDVSHPSKLPACLEIVADAATTNLFTHDARIISGSRASFSISFAWDGTSSSASTAGKQLVFVIDDGVHSFAAGLIGTQVGFLHADGSFLIGPPTATLVKDVFATFTIVINGSTAPADADGVDEISLYQNGRFICSSSRTSFPASGDIIAASQIGFGTADTAHFLVGMGVTQADWSAETSRDLANSRFTAETAAPFVIHGTTFDGPGFLDPDDVGRTIRVYNRGAAYGEWVITAVTDASHVTVESPLRTDATWISAYPSRVTVTRSTPFRFPEDLGRNITIEDGANSGERTIQDILDPITGESLRSRYAAEVALAPFFSTPLLVTSNLVELTDPLPVPSENGEHTWRFSSEFPSLSGLTCDLVGTATLSGDVITLRDVPPVLRLVEVEQSTVQSGYLYDDRVRDVEGVVGQIYRGFYLWNAWAWLRDVIDGLVPAGVNADYDRLVRDASGDFADPETDVRGLHLHDP